MAAGVPIGTRRRWLRPGALIPVGDHLWVLDDLHPVAAVLDTRTGHVIDVVGWPESPTGDDPHSRRVCAADDGIWVQQPPGPVLLVQRGAEPRGYFSRDLTLATTSTRGAWCAHARAALGYTARAADDPHGELSELRLLAADGGSRRVWVEGDVRSLRSDAGDLFIELADWDAVGARLGPDPDADPDKDPEPVPSRWLRLDDEGDVPDRLGVTSHGVDVADVPRPPCRRGVSPWLKTSPGVDGRVWEGLVPQARVAGLDWYVGREQEPRVVPPRLAAHGVDPDRRVVRRFPLGTGDVRDVASAGGQLWVTVCPPRVGPSHGREVPLTLLRVDGRDGSVTTALRPAEVEITDLAWPLVARPPEAEDYAADCLARLDHLQHHWTDATGVQHPLVDGMSECDAALHGRWPDTRLVVTFSWEGRPGLRLRRTTPLYDELGRVSDPEYADVSLMEDLETDRVPPASAAVSGVLDF